MFIEVFIIRLVTNFNLTTFVLKNLRQLFDKYAVARTKQDALVKSTTKIFFQILWPSQKTQTLMPTGHNLLNWAGFSFFQNGFIS